MKEFNINEYVYVELTIYGLNILHEYYEKIFNVERVRMHGSNSTYENVELHNMCVSAIASHDTEVKGIYKFQMYDLMHIFGSCLYMGNTNVPFKNLNILFKEKQNDKE